MPSESTLPVLSGGTGLEENPGSGIATPQDEENSKAIKYKILYKNDAGEPIKEDEQYKPWPKLMTADEEETTGTDSVLDIVTYVTIRQIAVSTLSVISLVPQPLERHLPLQTKTQNPNRSRAKTSRARTLRYRR